MQNHTRRMFLAALGGFLGSLAGGGAVRASAQTDEKPGAIFVITGVGGLDLVAMAAHWALPRSGVAHEVRQFVWTHGFGKVLKDLQDTPHALQKAHELADEIRAYKSAHPDRPVFVIGKSGGTALVLAAVAELPPMTVERIILLSAAVSPAYDLRPALRATRREIVSYYSPYDRFVLGWGTSQFGTMDRVYGPSAGLKRFEVPAGLSAEDQALYARLVQKSWEPGMIWEGNFGGHTGTSMPCFVAREIAPWLRP